MYRRAFNVSDFRALAAKRLPKSLFEFVDRGSEDDVALESNRAAFARVKFMPKVLVDISARSLSTELFGVPLSMPLAISPTGSAGLLWQNGELALARAAAAAGVPFTLATGSLTSIEQVAAEAGGRLWFQLYMWKRKELSYELVKRAEQAGIEALVLTVDAPIPSNREYNQRNGFVLPFRLNRHNIPGLLARPGWLAGVMGRYIASGRLPRFENYPEELSGSILARRKIDWLSMRPDSLNWDDVKELRQRWPRKLLIKGILRPDDAERALQCGADGVVVSNHGGRMLDGAIASLDALAAICAQVRARAPVLFDGGILRGSDVIKALALGASCVMVGRATLYGTAVDGQEGAARILRILADEMLTTMGLLGCPRIADISADCLQRT